MRIYFQIFTLENESRNGYIFSTLFLVFFLSICFFAFFVCFQSSLSIRFFFLIRKVRAFYFKSFLSFTSFSFEQRVRGAHEICIRTKLSIIVGSCSPCLLFGTKLALPLLMQLSYIFISIIF